MKKYISALSATGFYLLFAQSAFAQGIINACPGGTSGFSGLCAFSFSGTLISSIINILFIVAIIIALIYLIWGGIKWIMSGGDKAALQQAREHVIAAIIGLVVVFLAYFIVTFVLNLFGLGVGYNWTLPSLTG